MTMSRTWGEISYSNEEEEEQLDPVAVLMQEYETLKESPIIYKEGESLKAGKERRQHELYIIDKKIWDIIYIKRQKSLGQ